MSDDANSALVEANVQSAHDYQRGLFAASGRGDPVVWSSSGLADKLPVQVLSAHLTSLQPTWPRTKIRALANLVQMTLEIERDGDAVRQALELYHRLGLLTAPADYGLEHSEAEFLRVGTLLSERTCACPFGTAPADWQVALVKVQHWSMKLRGQNGVAELAASLLRQPDLQPLLPALRALPACRIMVIGHSFTLTSHWSTLAPMNEIVAEVFRGLNPGVIFGHYGHGGMSASVARDKYLAPALTWQPGRVLVATLCHGEKDYQALSDLVVAFRGAGAGTFCLDQLHPEPAHWLNPDRTRLKAIAGLTVLPVGERIMAHPGRADFVSLDGVHMRTSYHQFMAGELLRFLAAG